jgi:peptide/nickel transport system substrate-binding protein
MDAREALHRDLLAGTLTRRDVLRRAVALGLSAPVVTALLAACGGTPATPTVAPAGTGGGAGTPGAAQGKPGGELTFGLNLEPDNLDPAVTPFAVSHGVMMNIFDTLVWRGNDGKFYPGLAEKWEIGEDGKAYTFTLRKDVKFHDGTPFNAQAVKAQFDRTADPATKSGFAANLLGPYDRTEIVDDHTCKVIFKGPYAPFLDSASQAFLGIASPTAVQKDPKAFLRNPVGTGFMKFSEWVEKDHMTLVRNPDYNWAPPFFAHTGPAYLEKLHFRFYPEDPTRLAALESGDAQMIWTIPVSNVKRIEGEPGKYQVLHAFNPGVPTVVFMNTTKAPTDDLKVRQALITAVDRKALIETGLFGAARPARGPLWEGTPNYSKEVEQYYQHDPEKAKQLLQEAGWAPGADGIRAKGGQKLTLSWNVSPGSAAYDELLQTQFRALGMDVVLTRQTTAAVFDAATKGEINMAALGWISSDPVILTNLFHGKNTKSGYAWAKYSDPKLDELLDSGERTIDEAKRNQIYADAQKLIMDNALIIPLHSASFTIGVHTKYKGVKRDFRNYVWLYDTFIG